MTKKVVGKVKPTKKVAKKPTKQATQKADASIAKLTNRIKELEKLLEQANAEVQRLKDKYEKQYVHDDEPSIIPLIQPKSNSSKSSIILDQIDDIAVKFAQCCNPLPGDDIVGFITRGHGISVHTTSCTNYKAVLQRGDPEELNRWCDIQWSENSTSQLQTSFEVIAQDRMGLFYDISAALVEARVPIIHSSSRILKNGNALFESTIVISSTEQLRNLFDKLRKIKGVISVDRAAI